jgi:hypothetical protein
MTRTFADRPLSPTSTAYVVSHPHDPAERQAHDAADVVGRGGSVAGWRFDSVRPTAAVHRQETGKLAEKRDDKKEYVEAATTTVKALLETKEGKKAKELVLSTPLVKQTKQFFTTPIGIGTGGLLVAGGLAGLAAAKQPLPFQLPAVPLEKVHPALAGITGQVVIEGPLNAPTFVGLTLTFGGSPGNAGALGQEGQRPVQREPAAVTPRPTASLDTSGVAAVERSGGRPLEPSLRRRMEAQFGHDFSSVRVHDDGTAHAAARCLDAKAFTVGEHIALAEGQQATTSAEGRRLLAHELTHVIQQRDTPRRGQLFRQVTPPDLRTSVDLTKLTERELRDRHARILTSLTLATQSTPDTVLVEDELGAIGVELGRRAALAEGRTFSSTAIAKMRDYFVKNAKTQKDSCIVALNKGLKEATGDPRLPTTNKSIEATMAKLAAASRASAAREIWFNSRAGRITRGVARPDRLQASVFDSVVQMAAGDPGWSVFGLSLLDGYHSVTLTVDASDPAQPRVYWSDQWSSKGGWKEYDKAGLDAEVTRLVQGWWDEQPADRKHTTVVRLWRLRAAPTKAASP